MKSLTQLEFSPQDHETAEAIATALNRKENWFYTSTSDLIGLFCPKHHAADKQICVIKTKELGFLVVSDLDDLNLYELDAKQRGITDVAKTK